MRWAEMIRDGCHDRVIGQRINANPLNQQRNHLLFGHAVIGALNRVQLLLKTE